MVGLSASTHAVLSTTGMYARTGTTTATRASTTTTDRTIRAPKDDITGYPSADTQAPDSAVRILQVETSVPSQDTNYRESANLAPRQAICKV